MTRLELLERVSRAYHDKSGHNPSWTLCGHEMCKEPRKMLPNYEDDPLGVDKE